MKLDRSTLKKLALLIAFGVGFAWLLNNFTVVQGAAGFVTTLLYPFVLGLIIAFLLNIPMRGIERFVFRGRGGKARRPLSFLLALVLVIAVIGLVLFLVIPELVQTVIMLINAMPGYFTKLQEFIVPYEQYVPALQDFLDGLNIDWKTLSADAIKYLQSGAGSVFSSAWGFAFSLVSGTVNFFIGLIFTAYILLDKEHLHRQTVDLLKAYLKKERYEKLMDFARVVDKSFSQFVAGQCTEAVVIGAIFCVVLAILRFDYSFLIGVLIGFMSLIPVFGTTIACIVGALLILMSQGLWQAIFFVVLFLVIQQIDGNFIYPQIVGSSIGLPPIWVMVAVLLGGSLWGIAGMFFGIPLASVLYTLLRRSAKKRLFEKGYLDSPEDGPEPAERENRLSLFIKKIKAALARLFTKKNTGKKQPAPEEKKELPPPAPKPRPRQNKPKNEQKPDK
ncbi:MAG: AI-2E family transporter [Oscillospiraceae bacterium]